MNKSHPARRVKGKKQPGTKLESIFSYRVWLIAWILGFAATGAYWLANHLFDWGFEAGYITVLAATHIVALLSRAFWVFIAKR